MSAHALVVAGIYVRDGHLLLARRPLGGAYPGLWEFPGGKVEATESPEAALVREWREELGVSVSSLVPDSFSTESTGQTALTILFFRILCLRGEPRALGVASLRWCGPDEARLLALPPADGPVLERLIAGARGEFVDTQASGPDSPCAAAAESEPFIAGSERLEAGSVLRFVKRGLLGGGRIEGILLATATGVRAYENLCPHVPLPLDGGEERFFTRDGRYLACRQHGALFLPESGLCVAGPCKGERLKPIPLEPEGDGWAVAP